MDFMKKPLLSGIAIAILVTSLVGTGFYLSRKGDDQLARPSSVRVEVDKVRRGSLTREMTVVGTLESSNFVTMKAQVKGLISKVHVIGGEAVEKDDLLFEIDDRSYRAQLKEAKALLALAESAFEREKKLTDKKFGTAKKFEEARAQFLKAQAQVEKAQKDVDDTKIKAPFEGVVGLHKISEGTPITADLDLITITDTDPMKVNFKMPSKFVPYLSLDQRVSVEVDSYPGQKFKGRVEAIDAQIDVGAQSIAVQATIPNEKNLLKPGMFVRVKVVVGSKDNSLIVPEEAIVAAGDQTYVWKVIEHPEKPGLYVVFRVQVLTGIQEKDRLEITRNLRENDIIVTVGYQKVADGVPVSFDLRSVDLGPAEEEKTPADSEEKTAPLEETEPVKGPVKEIEKEENKTISPSLWSQIKGFFKSFKKGAPEGEVAPKAETPQEEPVKPLAKKEENPQAQEEAQPIPKADDKAPVVAPVAFKSTAQKTRAKKTHAKNPRAKTPRYYNKTNNNLRALFAKNSPSNTKKKKEVR